MPILDFDKGLAKRVGDVFNSAIPVEFMPTDLFERKRIMDKLNSKETFSFISFWRSGTTFDVSRFDPSQMYEQNVGYYDDDSMESATLFNLFPVKFHYELILWETKREAIDLRWALMLKSLYRKPIVDVHASDTKLHMRCYTDFNYELEISEEYVLEKENKVPYFKGTTEFQLEGWLYNKTNTEESGAETKLIKCVHSFIYNDNLFLMDEIKTPENYQGDTSLPDDFVIY